MNKLQRWSIGIDLEKGFYSRQDDNGAWVDYKEAADLIEQLQRERDEMVVALYEADKLRCNSEEVTGSDGHYKINSMKLDNIFCTSPSQSLNALKREVAREAYWQACEDFDVDGTFAAEASVEDYINTKYPTTEGE